MKAGRPPISTDIIDQAKQMIAEGELSDRMIAKTLKIGKGVVNRLHNGTYNVLDNKDEDDLSPGEIRIDTTCQKAPRCQTCGGLLEVIPCRLCRVRKCI